MGGWDESLPLAPEPLLPAREASSTPLPTGDALDGAMDYQERTRAAAAADLLTKSRCASGAHP